MTGKKSDMWSLGVLLFAMVTGRLPWTQKNQRLLFDDIKHTKYTIPEEVSENCRDLISQLICASPDQRITATDTLNHPWIAECDREITFIDSVLGVSLKSVDRFLVDKSFEEFQNVKLDHNESTNLLDVNYLKKSYNNLRNFDKPLYEEADSPKTPPNIIDQAAHRRSALGRPILQYRAASMKPVRLKGQISQMRNRICTLPPLLNH